MRKATSFQPAAAPQASAADAAAYASSDADHSASSGARLARQRPARSPARRKASSAAPNARSGSTPSSVGASLRRMAEKRYLFTPGPTPVPPEVLEAMSRPMIHHRSSDFRAIFGSCLDRLGPGYRTERD